MHTSSVLAHIMNSIVISKEHRMPTPLLINLGTHTLVITSDYGTPDAFALVARVIKDGVASPDDGASTTTVIFDHEETYHLYQCLQSLFQPSGDESSE